MFGLGREKEIFDLITSLTLEAVQDRKTIQVVYEKTIELRKEIARLDNSVNTLAALYNESILQLKECRRELAESKAGELDYAKAVANEVCQRFTGGDDASNA